MRHQKKTLKLGRTAEHRKALLANQVCSLIEHQRIKTTLAKAKAVRPLAEKMVTLGKKGSLHARRTALAVLRQKDAVKKLFDDIAPRSADRNGGYTRIVKLGAAEERFRAGRVHRVGGCAASSRGTSRGRKRQEEQEQRRLAADDRKAREEVEEDRRKPTRNSIAASDR